VTPLKVLDLFAGTGSATEAFEKRGHTVVSVELDERFEATIHGDVAQLDAKALTERYGRFDFIWASPPCTAFSIAAVSHHWDQGRPRTKQAVEAQLLVAATLRLIDELAPRYGWLMENPRAMLRKLSVVEGRPRSTVTYCQYGDFRMKPTDLWGGIGKDGWLPNLACTNGSSCHEAAPRGSRKGTQSLSNAEEKGRIPYGLSEWVAHRVEMSALGDKYEQPDEPRR